ncbi:MAG: FAD-dependent oxidoreductase, partial [Cyanobacteria bacterium K_DeepCast_35m_m2_023]|nr:FAD-dependent oxidoreductase [Cyanobacteria bacterium K_DeepCast_35m_m2_023]
IDPLPLLEALHQDGARLGVMARTTTVRQLRRLADHQWQLELADGTSLSTAWLVICAGAGTAPLLADLGLTIPLAPVLGQAVELAPAAGAAPWTWGDHWPAAAVWQGINLVPRPGGRLWLGATLEPGATADPAALQRMTTLNGQAPGWLHNPTVVRRWQGLRMQPQGRGAPWLEQLAPGLLLAGGHYRNGVLLAPASAEWLANALETP